MLLYRYLLIYKRLYFPSQKTDPYDNRNTTTANNKGRENIPLSGLLPCGIQPAHIQDYKTRIFRHQTIK